MGCCTPLDGAVANGVSGLRWIMQRWRESRPRAHLRGAPDPLPHRARAGGAIPECLPDAGDFDANDPRDSRLSDHIERLLWNPKAAAVCAAIPGEPAARHPYATRPHTPDELEAAAAAKQHYFEIPRPAQQRRRQETDGQTPPETSGAPHSWR